MPKTRRKGGALQIKEAASLFYQTRDYRYVALAIGASINDPPKWALIECWRLKKMEEREPALASSLPNAHGVLDRAVELIIEHEDAHFDKVRSGAFKRLPLETALKRALLELAPGRDDPTTVDLLKKAWKREATEELMDWEEREGDERGGAHLKGYKTTVRIDRVIMRVEARKKWIEDPDGPWVEDPNDLVFWARMAGEL